MIGQSAVDQISLGLSALKVVIREKHNRDDLVDLVTKLNQAQKNLESNVDTLKASIKTSLLEEGKTIAEGEQFIAVLSIVERACLMTEKVKAFLGKKLNEYQEIRKENHLTFKPKV